MAADLLRLEVRTPERLVFEGGVKSVLLRGVNGEFQILVGHEPLIAPLIVHRMVAEDAADREVAVAVHAGALRVRNDVVTVLADAAELAKDIDVERAEAAKSRAEERIEGGDGWDGGRALEALVRAQLRLEVADTRR